MALKERKLWKTIKPVLEKVFHAYRIESSITPGFPDVVLIHKKRGNIFLLELKSWRSSSHVPTFGGLSTTQRNFHTNARMAGVNNFVIAINNNNEYYIFQPDGVNPINATIIRNIKGLSSILLLRSEEDG